MRRQARTVHGVAVLAAAALATTSACSSSTNNQPDAGGGDAAATCPDEHGAFSVALTGAGCGDLDSTATQCVQQVGCGVTFLSNLAGSQRALNGSAKLGTDGSFTGATITEGTASRTGCTGTWDATAQVLTVDCGGTGSSQSCVATLTRTGATCM